MRISEIAERSGCTVETIRFYEAKGLLPNPARTRSNYRVYNEAHFERVMFIRHCRSLDLSLEEIRLLVHLISTTEADELEKAHNIVETHLKNIDEKIDELYKLKAQLSRIQAACRHEDHEHGHCGVIDGLRHNCARM